MSNLKGLKYKQPGRKKSFVHSFNKAVCKMLMKLTTKSKDNWVFLVFMSRTMTSCTKKLAFSKIFKCYTAICSVSGFLTYFSLMLVHVINKLTKYDDASILKRCLISNWVHVIALLRELRYSTPSLSLSAALLVCVAFLPSACI